MLIEKKEKVLSIARKKRIRPKRRPAADPRQGYEPRELGYIIQSTTKQIGDNSQLAEAMNGAENLESLLKPIFQGFFEVNGLIWQILEPTSLSAHKKNSPGDFQTVSALGGEKIEFNSVVLGKRDGICIKWDTNDIIGQRNTDDEIIIDTTIKGFGLKIVTIDGEGNPANRKKLKSLLLERLGNVDIVKAAELAKEQAAEIERAAICEEIARKSEAYGDTFGAWG